MVLANDKLYEFNLMSKNKIIGTFSFCVNNEELYLVNIYIDINYRNMGHGTFIINHIKKICVENGIKVIKVDDCSDNFNKKNNIYLNNGFKYIQHLFPEMEFHF